MSTRYASFFNLFEIQPSAEFIRQAETLAETVGQDRPGITYLRNAVDGSGWWIQGRVPSDIHLFLGFEPWHFDGYAENAREADPAKQIFLAGPSPKLTGDSVVNAEMVGWKHSLSHSPRRTVSTTPRKKARKR